MTDSAQVLQFQGPGCRLTNIYHMLLFSSKSSNVRDYVPSLDTLCQWPWMADQYLSFTEYLFSKTFINHQISSPTVKLECIWCFFVNVSSLLDRGLKQHKRPQGTNLTWYVNVISSCLLLGVFFTSSPRCSLRAKNVLIIILFVDTSLACELGV